MPRLKIFSFAAGLIISGFTCAAGAAPLVTYNFGSTGQESTNENSPAFNPTTTDGNIVATAVKDTSGKVGIEISSAATTPLGAPYNRVDPQNNANSASAAVTNGVYFSFTVTPNASMSLTNLQFDAARGGTGTPRGYDIRSSVDNYAATLGTADLATVRPAYTPVNIDLSAPAFQDLTAPVTFRFYVYSTGGGASVDFDNIALNGTATPEPASLTLIGLGGVVLLRRSRKA
jgi:hypothetical protein